MSEREKAVEPGRHFPTTLKIKVESFLRNFSKARKKPQCDPLSLSIDYILFSPTPHPHEAHKNVIINLQPDARTVAHVMDSVR